MISDHSLPVDQVTSLSRLLSANSRGVFGFASMLKREGKALAHFLFTIRFGVETHSMHLNSPHRGAVERAPPIQPLHRESGSQAHLAPGAHLERRSDVSHIRRYLVHVLPG